MKRRGLTTSLDTNDDPEDKWDGVLEDVLPLVDLLLCTEEELAKDRKGESRRGACFGQCAAAGCEARSERGFCIHRGP